MHPIKRAARWLFLALLVATLAATATASEPVTLRVMSYNLWHGGDAGKQPLGQTIEVIRKARADVVGLQETAGYPPQEPRPDNAQKLAKALGWHYLDQGDRTGIISRWPIVANSPRKWGAAIELPSGRRTWLFNAHLAHAPYQPYQLLGIEYEKAPFLKEAAEALAAAKSARGPQVERLLAEVRDVVEPGTPAFITGDFNEPSHQDWTVAAARAKCCPLSVDWPSTKTVVDADFVDAYRQTHPDETRHRGSTWTPLTSVDDPKDRHDRIDFVFANAAAKVVSVEIVGESARFADLVVDPYPSDHRAVVATVEIGKP